MAHSCYACAPANPDRVFTYSGRSAALFPMRFNGPPGNANGGIAVGALACPALASADDGLTVTRITARLRRGIPCGEPLTAHAVAAEGATTVGISDDDGALVEATVWLSSEQGPSGVATALIAELAPVARSGAGARLPFFEETGDHPIPGCFSCGPDNPRGMHIYPRVVSDGVTCAPWHASAEFDDGGGALSPMIVTSALDCSSGICMPLQMQRDLLADDAFFLLGSLDVRFLRAAPVGQDYQVVAKALQRDGRKFFGASVLFAHEGTAYATAEATWIIAGISRTEAFGGR